MVVDLSNLLDETTVSIHFDEAIDLEKIDANGRDLYFTQPIKVSGDIYKVSRDLFIEGQIICKYKENCARCLKEFEQEIKTSLSGKLVNIASIDEVEDTDEVIIRYENKKLDIKDAVIKEIILKLPMKSLCKSNCKGICPKCGKDLNTGECDCVIEDIDPRLAKLKELL